MRVNDNFYRRATFHQPLRWLRLPHGETAVFTANPTGATLYRKTDHLTAPIR